MEGQDRPAFATLRADFADVLGGPPHGLLQDRDIELPVVLETGNLPTVTPWTRPLKRLLEGELAEMRRQLRDLLDRDRGWIQRSTAGHAASAVFCPDSDSSWRICNRDDYRGLNAVTEREVETLLYVDALLDATRGAKRSRATQFDLLPRVTTRCCCGRPTGGRLGQAFAPSWAS